ncbi:MAG: hypothetical protein J6L88_03050 [Clostridia bacterium]|nr:hypothetical protein [Clostridia bacterium]
MFCQTPINASGCANTAQYTSACQDDLYILAERIFDSCRLKKKLTDVRLQAENLRPCDDCGSCAPPCPPLRFLGGSSACSDVELCDLIISDADDASGCGHHKKRHDGCCSCGCDDGLRRVRGKAHIPLNLYFQDSNCRRYVGDGCVTIHIDILLRMPTDAQIPPRIRTLGSAMFCGGCECDDGFHATLEAAVFIFVTGTVAMRVTGQTVTDIPACKNTPAGNSCCITDNCLDTLPLFPDLRIGGYVLNPKDPACNPLLFAPGSSACPQAD